MKKLFSILIFLLPTIALAELAPSSVAVLVNAKVPESIAVGKHYIEKRNIPASNLIEVPVSPDEHTAREDYDAFVLEVRKQLIDKKLADKIKVIVTTYGIPLKVGPGDVTATERLRLEEAKKKRKDVYRALSQLSNEMDAFLGAGATSLPKPIEPEENSPSEVFLRYEKELFSLVGGKLQKAAGEIVAEKNPEEQKKKKGKLFSWVSKFGGLSQLKQLLVPAKDNTKGQEDLQKLEALVNQSKVFAIALMKDSDIKNQLKGYELVNLALGAQGVLFLIHTVEGSVDKSQVLSSLDSELSFLWWDREDYLLNGFLPNPFNPKIASKLPAGAKSPIPLLLVSRLDGPSPEIAKGLVDKALQAEKEGLKGTVYVDRRGEGANTAELLQVDESLEKFSDFIDDANLFDDVEVERTSVMLKSAKETALYVGWYKLRDYDDVFTFNPGAVGYHIASFEGLSLRSPTETGWCANMLKHGITATLGSVEEPFLGSFPNPTLFFGFLLSGKYNLLDSYYLTVPNLSWRMFLVGDPLYNPLKGKSKLELKYINKELPDELIFADFPQAPSDQPFEDPILARQKLKETQAQSLSQAEALFANLASFTPIK